jgi:hypothetical protein
MSWDDLALGRRLKAQGLASPTGGRPGADQPQDVSHLAGRSSRGFSKNLFAALGYRLIPFVLVWLWLGIVFLQPVIMLARGAGGCAHSPALLGAWRPGAVGPLDLLVGDHLLGGSTSPRYLPLLYPLSILLGVIIAFRSLALTLAGSDDLEGRRLVGMGSAGFESAPHRLGSLLHLASQTLLSGVRSVYAPRFLPFIFIGPASGRLLQRPGRVGCGLSGTWAQMQVARRSSKVPFIGEVTNRNITLLRLSQPSMGRASP